MHACKQPPRCSDCVSVGYVVLCPVFSCLVLMHSMVFGACLRGSVESWQANPSSSSRTVNLYSNAPLVGLTLNGAPVLDAERMPNQVCFAALLRRTWVDAPISRMNTCGLRSI